MIQVRFKSRHLFFFPVPFSPLCWLKAQALAVAIEIQFAFVFRPVCLVGRIFCVSFAQSALEAAFSAS